MINRKMLDEYFKLNTGFGKSTDVKQVMGVKPPPAFTPQQPETMSTSAITSVPGLNPLGTTSKVESPKSETKWGGWSDPLSSVTTYTAPDLPKPRVYKINIPEKSRIAYVHNNPGNLKFADQQDAVRGEPAADGGHWAKFPSKEIGYERIKNQIRIDANRGMTVGEFVNKYAPPETNDTKRYEEVIKKRTGYSLGTKLSEVDQDVFAKIQALHESGTVVE